MSPQQNGMTLNEFLELLRYFKSGGIWKFRLEKGQLLIREDGSDADVHPISAVCAAKFVNKEQIESTIDSKVAAAILGLSDRDSDALIKACKNRRTELFHNELIIRSALLRVAGLNEE